MAESKETILCKHCDEPIQQNAPGHSWRHWGTYISCYRGDAITHATPKEVEE